MTDHLKELRGITVNQHLQIRQQEEPKATGEFTRLLSEIVVASKIVRSKVTLAGIAEVLGNTGEQNVQGETVKMLDMIGNAVFIKRLLATGLVCMIISEESDEPIIAEEDTSGKYVIAMDPLDGSSNIACNIPVGTIFGVWKRKSPRDQRPTMEDALQPGKDMVCAGYVLYGPSSMLVFSTGKGVNGFTYDPSIGEYILTHKDMQVPKVSQCYSINEAYAYYWDEATRNFVEWVKTPDKATHRPYGGRYVGSLVADVHRNLLYGGIYAYPGDSRSPNGKLRLMYENAPLAYLLEQAGGRASTGRERILDIVPESIHQRTPLWIGTRGDVELVENLYKESQKGRKGAGPN